MSGEKRIQIDLEAAARHIAAERRQQRLARHRRAVRKSRARLERLLEQAEAVGDAAPAEQKELAALRQRLEALTVPERLAAARAAEGEAAELVRRATETLHRAELRQRLVTACRDGGAGLSEADGAKSLAVRRQEFARRFGNLLEKARSSPLRARQKERIVQELERLRKESQAFLACARRMAELEAYTDSIRGQPWAHALAADEIVERLATAPELTAAGVRKTLRELTRQAVEAFEAHGRDRVDDEERRREAEAEALRAAQQEIDRRRDELRGAGEKYREHCQPELSEVETALLEAGNALASGRRDEAESHLERADRLHENIPVWFEERSRAAREVARGAAERRWELVARIGAARDQLDEVELEVDSREELLATCRRLEERAATDVADLAGVEVLAADVERLEQRLRTADVERELLRAVHDLGELDGFEWDKDTLAQILSGQRHASVMARLGTGEELELEVSRGAGGRLQILKLDLGKIRPATAFSNSRIP